MDKNRLVKQTRCALLLYLVAIFVAMPLYAGGTYAIKDIATSYNFFTNFLSDLGRTTSHSGDLNFFSSFLFKKTSHMHPKTPIKKLKPYFVLSKLII